MAKTPYRKPAERAPVPRELRRWYTKSGDVEKGPFEPVAIRLSINEGHLRRSTLVRAEDETQWRPASEVTDITRGVRPSAKPPPAQLAEETAPQDGSSTTLVYAVLACGLAYVGLVFAVMGIVRARDEMRRGAGKYTRRAYSFSIVGLFIQLVLVAFAITVLRG